MSTFQLKIVTPDQCFFAGEVEMVIARTTEGDMAVLKGHSPFAAPLVVGEIRVKQDGKFRFAAGSGGFISVTKDMTTIITDAAEWADNIDCERAQKAKERSEHRLHHEINDIDADRAKIALLRALNRLRVVERSQHHSK